MNNVFVSYEVASELKELGFDESCFGYYDCERDFKFLPNKSEFLECEFAAPTFSHVFRFFREKYDLFGCIDLHVSTPLHWYVRIDKISINDYLYHSEDDSIYYANYEDAELACLKLLIELVKNL